MEGQQTVQSATESTTKQFVSFRVHTRCYAVPIETVVEMTLLQNPEPIAGATDPGQESADQGRNG